MKDGIGITGIGLVLTVIIANGPASYSQTWVQATRFVFPGRINPSRRKRFFCENRVISIQNPVNGKVIIDDEQR